MRDAGTDRGGRRPAYGGLRDQPRRAAHRRLGPDAGGHRGAARRLRLGRARDAGRRRRRPVVHPGRRARGERQRRARHRHLDGQVPARSAPDAVRDRGRTEPLGRPVIRSAGTAPAPIEEEPLSDELPASDPAGDSTPGNHPAAAAEDAATDDIDPADDGATHADATHAGAADADPADSEDEETPAGDDRPPSRPDDGDATPVSDNRRRAERTAPLIAGPGGGGARVGGGGTPGEGPPGAGAPRGTLPGEPPAAGPALRPPVQQPRG